MGFFFEVNGLSVEDCFRNDDYSQESCSVILKLEKGDLVKIMLDATQYNVHLIGGKLSFFSGYLLESH